jgi:hypothetical protein
MGRACSANGRKMNACTLFLEKPEGKRSVGRARRRRVDNIKVSLREIGWGGVDCINLAQDRKRWRSLVNTVIKLRVP